MPATRPTRLKARHVSKHPEQIIAAAEGKVDGQILAAAWGKPRGSTTAGAGAGVIVAEIGAKLARSQHKGAGEVDIKLGNPGALILTPTSLITAKVGVSAMGSITEIKELLSTVPLETVDSIEVKRMGFTGLTKITCGDSSFKLEGKVDDMRALAAAFEGAKTAGGASV